MNKAKLNWFISGGYQSNVQSWLIQGTTNGGTPPSATVLTALSVFLNSLNGYGLLSRMKTGNIMHCGSKEFTKLNIKDVSTYPWTESGTVTFSEGNGCRSASSSYFNQPFKTDEYSGIETNSTFIQYISESSTASSAAKVSHGFRTHSTSSFFLANTPLSSATLTTPYHYNTGINASSTNHKGLYVITRNSGVFAFYKDGSKSTGGTAATIANISTNRLILAYNGATTSSGVTPTAYYPHYVAIDFIFDGFSDTDELNFRTAFDTYKTAVGLP